MRVISQKLRDFAKGKDCTLRIPSICNFNPETTVLAHLPCGHSGGAMKSPDQMAVHACFDCHAYIDSEKRWNVSAYDYLRALAETQMRLIEAGLMTIKGMR